MTLSKMFVWFVIYSFMGWIYESCFCTIKNRQWENRGFLHGPIVPIYGVGALLASLVFGVFPMDALQDAKWYTVFIISFLGSIVLEYSTSWALEKLFNAYWWDYSDQFCNIHGRVCLGASLGFGVAGILVIRVIYPFVNNITVGIPPLLMEFLALAFMLIFGMDMALTVSALTNFAKNVARIENEINEQLSAAYNKLDSGVVGALETVKEKSELIQEGATSKKELAEEKITALREQLTAERIESLFLSASPSQKHTLLGIQGFRKNEQSNALQRMRTMITEKKPGRKNK